MEIVVKKILWDNMLDADMNERYWHHLGKRYYSYDKYAKIFLAVMNPMHFVTGILDDKLPRLINVIYSIIAGIGQLFTGKRSLSSIFSGLKKNPEKAVPKPKTNITEEFDEKERESVRESVRRSVRMRSSKRASKRSIKNRISSRRRSSSKRASKRTRSRRVSSRRTNSRKN